MKEKKFVFHWKDGVLDFTYEEEGSKKLENHFVMDEDADVQMQVPEDNIHYIEGPTVNTVPNSLGNSWNSIVAANPGIPTDVIAPWVNVPTAAVPLVNPTETVKEEPIKVEEKKEEIKVEEPVNELEKLVANIHKDMEEPKKEEEPLVLTNFPLAPVVEEKVEEPVVHDVILNADNLDIPTVQVQVPAIMPQIAYVTSEMVANAVVDTINPDPQILLKVEDASVKIPEDVVLDVVKTPNGSSDVVIAIDPITSLEAEAHNINVKETIAAALNEVENHPELPDLNVDVKQDVIPQVVGMKVDGDTVHLTDVSGNIPADATLIPVQTPDMMPNIVAAIDPATVAEFEAKGLDPQEELSKFLKDSDTGVVTVVPVNENAIAEAFNLDDKVEEPAEKKVFVRDRESEE